MTDHSILTAGAPDLPFQREAKTLTGLLKFVFVKVPEALHQAVLSYNLVTALDNLSDAQLAEIGIRRDTLVAYAAERTGILPKKAG